MVEEWRIVVGNDNYLVSSYGRVYSKLTGIYLRPGIASHGYPTVVLRGKGASIGTRTVHSLVMEAFVGPRPEKQEIRHHDGVRANSRLDNLSYSTHSENIADCYKHGTRSKEKDLAQGRAVRDRKIASDPDYFIKSNRKGTETKDRRYGREWSRMSFSGISYKIQGENQ